MFRIANRHATLIDHIHRVLDQSVHILDHVHHLGYELLRFYGESALGNARVAVLLADAEVDLAAVDLASDIGVLPVWLIDGVPFTPIVCGTRVGALTTARRLVSPGGLVATGCPRFPGQRSVATVRRIPGGRFVATGLRGRPITTGLSGGRLVATGHRFPGGFAAAAGRRFPDGLVATAVRRLLPTAVHGRRSRNLRRARRRWTR